MDLVKGCVFLPAVQLAEGQRRSTERLRAGELQLDVALAVLARDSDTAVVVDRRVPGQLTADGDEAVQQDPVVIGENREAGKLRGIWQGERVVELLPVVDEAIPFSGGVFDQRWVKRQRIRMD